MLIVVASSRLFSMSRSTNTQLAAGFNASSFIIIIIIMKFTAKIDSENNGDE